MDRRLLKATARVAHVSLRGQVEAERYVEGEKLRLVVPLADLRRAPGGARDRQLVFGEGFTVIDRERGHAFGFAERDGYCGWLEAGALGVAPEPTHFVASSGTHAYAEPRVQSAERPLPAGALVTVTGVAGKFAVTAAGHVPASHLRALGDWLTDPVAVAEQFLGVPYLWGGNSAAGVDCSGLVQRALLACGIACPGDSDMQQALGTEIPPDSPLQRGDLLFWRGHVALVVDGERLIHANGQTMSVAYEGIAACIARIEAQEGGVVTHRRRL
jgi:cell wall-associated NlpC family hydrolase